ncbi:MAG: cyclophilin-like fold protein [bacterium]|nr:cyclophilin-like fold protein [bacterium]
MRKKMKSVIMIGAIALVMAGCSSNNSTEGNNTPTSNSTMQVSPSTNVQENSITDATIQFGQNGEKYTIKFENNETARELAKNITNAGRQLPIYNFDDFEGYEYFQYYDIPSSYVIASNPETVTSQKAGEIYYSAPNRVILFYQDANISGEYTKIGEITNIEGLKESVENNPVLEGWGNKLILLEYVE